jgi:hypothetical protein
MKRSSSVAGMYKGGLMIKNSGSSNRQKSKPIKCLQCYRTTMIDGKCSRCRYETNPSRMMII